MSNTTLLGNNSLGENIFPAYGSYTQQIAEHAMNMRKKMPGWSWFVIILLIIIFIALVVALIIFIVEWDKYANKCKTSKKCGAAVCDVSGLSATQFDTWMKNNYSNIYNGSEYIDMMKEFCTLESSNAVCKNSKYKPSSS